MPAPSEQPAVSRRLGLSAALGVAGLMCAGLPYLLALGYPLPDRRD